MHTSHRPATGQLPNPFGSRTSTAMRISTLWSSYFDLRGKKTPQDGGAASNTAT